MKMLTKPQLVYCDMVGNRGFTGSCTIQTSHIAIHTWDECTPAIGQIDLYTCSELPVDKVIELIDNRFRIIGGEYIVLDRSPQFTIIEQQKLYGKINQSTAA